MTQPIFYYQYPICSLLVLALFITVINVRMYVCKHTRNRFVQCASDSFFNAPGSEKKLPTVRKEVSFQHFGSLLVFPFLFFKQSRGATIPLRNVTDQGETEHQRERRPIIFLARAPSYDRCNRKCTRNVSTFRSKISRTYYKYYRKKE